MKNYQKTAFLEQGYAILSEPEQEYMQNLLHSLLDIQNTAPAAPAEPPDQNQSRPEPQKSGSKSPEKG